MSLGAILLVAVAVSVDGLWGGLAFGLRRIRIPHGSLLLVAILSGGASGLAMLLGRVLGRGVPLMTAKWVSAALLLGLGVTALWEAYQERLGGRAGLPPGRAGGGEARPACTEGGGHYFRHLLRVLADPELADADYSGDISLAEAWVLGIAVAIDASLAAFTIGLAGRGSWAVPSFIGAARYVLIGLGNLLGSRRLVAGAGSRLTYLPGGILVLLGLLRFR
ncbi:MAG: manganese efflux pump [Chitinophagales bacterium]